MRISTALLKMMRERLKCKPLCPSSCPSARKTSSRGIIDLIDMQADVYYDDLGNDIRVEPIPEDMRELAEQYRAEMLGEAIAEGDEELMMKYLDGEELTKEEIKKAPLRKETIANTVVPVTCGTSYPQQGRSEAAGRHRGLHARSHRYRGHQGC